MNFPRVAVVGWLTAASTLLGCSSSDTIVALNVSSSAEVGPVSRLHVTITQDGEPFTHDFEPPSVEVMDGGGTVIAPDFFERIKVPDGWRRAKAEIVVDAINEGDTPFLSSMTEVTIRPEGAVAAYVMFALPVPPPSDGGEGGQGAGGEGSGGAPSEGGAGSGGTTAGSGGAPTDAGTGGTSGSAGADAGASGG